MGVSARITGADKELVNEEGSITFYHIVVHDNDHHWIVHKRYSDFHILDRRLQDSGELTTLKLPTKGLFGLRHRLDIFNFNEERQEGLQSYLLHLTRQLECLAQSPILSAFLESRRTRTPQRSLATPARASAPYPLPAGPEPDAPAESAQGAAGDGAPGQRLLVAISRTPLIVRADRSLDFLQSPEWKRFEAAQPALADSVHRCSELLATNRFENDSEAVFISLRRNIRTFARELKAQAGSEPGIADVPGKEFVWEFLLQFAARRGFYKNQAAEVVAILEASIPWAKILADHEDLRRLRDEVL